MVESLDQSIGRLIAVLQAAGQWRSTVTFCVGDNGGHPEVADNRRSNIGGL